MGSQRIPSSIEDLSDSWDRSTLTHWWHSKSAGLAGAGGGIGPLPPLDDDEDGDRRRARRRQQQKNNNNNNNINDDGAQLDGNNRARKSGKKARRRDLAQRREIQNQRQAAAALGLENGVAEDPVAIQQRLEGWIRNEGR